MRRRILLSTFAGLWLALLLAPAAARAEAIRHGQGLLWRVEKPGVPASHVFGTIHTVDHRVLTLPKPVTEALAAARSLCVELILDEATDRSLAQAATLPADSRLEDIVGKKMFGRVVGAGRRYGIEAERLQRLKPWALVSLFGIPPADVARMSAGEPVLDDWLQLDAAQRGVPVYGLETTEEQIAVFDTMPEAEQITLLDGTLADSEHIDELFGALVDRYLARDVAAIYGMLVGQPTDAGRASMRSFEKRLILDRNRRMAARLTERLAGGNAFVAVGALHLPGDKGVLHLLEGQGFRVTRVY